MARTVFIGIARMGSSRLPGKVLMDLAGAPVMQWVIDAAWLTRSINDVWIATSTDPRDDEIEEWCHGSSVRCFRGSEDDVLARFAGAAQAANADVVIRATCDCPLLDPNVIGEVIRLRQATNADYACNIHPPTWPDGLDCEVFTRDALDLANCKATRPTDRECVTTYIVRNRHRFSVENLTCPIPNLHRERWVLDTEDDLKFCREIAERVKGHSYLDVLNVLDSEPHLREINRHHPRNERYYENLVREEPIRRKYVTSRNLLARAERVIPLGAQTFSKSKLQFPEQAPLFVTHGEGGHVFDVDGNEYVDLVGGLLPNILGYNDPDVDRAIRSQLDRGISFSLATELEAQLAVRLCRIIPGADMVRFGKTGTDVTTAAVRLARAYTGRNEILSSGYHGWGDWSVGNDVLRGRGVPPAVAKLTTGFDYGDIERVERELQTRRFAACVVEPETNPGQFLEKLRRLCNATSTLLIFDEIITGFRWSLGGAQKYFAVTPDLSTWGKALGNGMPISALVGYRDIMQKLAPPNNIFYSGTFFGESLSLAAAIATIDKLESENVVEKLHDMAARLRSKVSALGNKSVCLLDSPLARVSFGDANKCDNASSADIATLFRQEMIANGVLIINSNNFCYAHTEADMERIINAYDRTLAVLADATQSGDVRNRIHGVPLMPAAVAGVRSFAS